MADKTKSSLVDEGKKAEVDKILRQYDLSPQLKELLFAKKETPVLFSYPEEEFLIYCIEWYQDGTDTPFPKLSFASSLKGVKSYLQKHGKKFFGDEIDRQLIRDFNNISHKKQPLGLVQNEYPRNIWSKTGQWFALTQIWFKERGW